MPCLPKAIRILMLGTAVLSLSLLGASQNKQLLTAENILAVKQLSDPQISPSGNWVALVVSGFEPNRQRNSDIWLISRDGLNLNRITTDTGPDTTPRWSPDGKILAFLSRPAGEKYSQVYFYTLADRKIQKKTAANCLIRDFKWSTLGDQLALSMRDQLTRTDIRRSAEKDDAWEVGHNYKHFRLWLLDIVSGNARLLTQQDRTIVEFNFSPNGKKIAALSAPCPTAECTEYNSRLELIDIRSGETSVLASQTNILAAPSFSPDGQKIAYIGPEGSFQERGVVKVIPSLGGNAVALLRDIKSNIWDVKWHPTWNSLVAAAARGVKHRLLSIDLQQQTQLMIEMNYSQIPYWQDTWSISNNGNLIAFISEQPDSPAELWIATCQGTGLKRLSRFNDFLRSFRLGKVEAVQWNNPDDGARVDGIIVKPPDFQPGRSYPLITWFHGGPAYNWSEGVQTKNWAQLFAARGYMVFLPNFRGSSGQGMDWMSSNVRNWGSGPMSDVMSGVTYLISKGWADKNRLYLGGQSYGGYLTAWIITQTDRFNAAYICAGITDLATEFQLTDEPSFLLGYFNAAPFEDPKIYQSNSPLTYAAQVQTPVLITHGEKDQRVPVSQSYQFFSALKFYGAEAKLVIYPREAHGLREYAHQLDAVNRLLEWFHKY